VPNDACALSQGVGFGSLKTRSVRQPVMVILEYFGGDISILPYFVMKFGAKKIKLCN
jgi:hypothetical protein